jgi:hypothetical protein
MGQLKKALIAFDEQRMAKGKPILDPRNRGMEDSDEDWALYEAEFNDWLDKYEASFGDEKGYLP